MFHINSLKAFFTPTQVIFPTEFSSPSSDSDSAPHGTNCIHPALQEYRTLIGGSNQSGATIIIEPIVLETIAYCFSRLLIGYCTYERPILLTRFQDGEVCSEARRYCHGNFKPNKQNRWI